MRSLERIVSIAGATLIPLIFVTNSYGQPAGNPIAPERCRPIFSSGQGVKAPKEIMPFEIFQLPDGESIQYLGHMGGRLAAVDYLSFSLRKGSYGGEIFHISGYSGGEIRVGNHVFSVKLLENGGLHLGYIGKCPGK